MKNQHRRASIGAVVIALLYLPLSGVASENLSSCAAILSGESFDFPIERVYPNQEIPRDLAGIPVPPIGSRAFILWRQRSSPWLPDTAFLFHYLGKEDVVALALATGRSLVETARRTELEPEAPPSAPAQERQESVPPVVSFQIPEALRRYAPIGELAGFAAEHIDWVVNTHFRDRHSILLKILFVSHEGRLSLVGFSEAFDHQQVANALIAANPGLRIVTGDSVWFDYYSGDLMFRRGSRAWLRLRDEHWDNDAFLSASEGPDEMVQTAVRAWVPALERSLGEPVTLESQND